MEGPLSESTRPIHEGNKFTLDLVRRPDGEFVILKYPTASLPPPSISARLDHEYEMGCSLHLPSVREVLGRRTWKGRSAIELQYIPGETFKSYFQKPRHIETVMRLALSAATALKSLHENGFVHRDIAAGNLLVSADESQAIIIDLGLAAPISPTPESIYSVEGQLPYLSPEQTGRIDLPVDFRSDLYSFGVVFYEMLTGQLPFDAEDTAGWIHAHLALRPEPPISRKPDLPPGISEIAMHLLAKEPDDRYQTAQGLCRDLDLCLRRFRETGTIPYFLPGQGDHPGYLRFPQTLYGREDEMQRLNVALQRAVNGQPGLIFVEGYAGAGKTALITELRFPVSAAAGHFIAGKFDQTLRAVPYSAFAEAMHQLCGQLLSGPREELQAFRTRFLETVGSNARLLYKLVPRMEGLLGPIPFPGDLPEMESANRFLFTMLGFFHSLIEPEHPLVLFLDDLQWADSGSLELLKMILTRSVRHHYLIIGAFRPNELGDDHPLSHLITNLQMERPEGIQRLPLEGLTELQSEELVADTLVVTRQQAGPLAALLFEKTGGNPFFLKQVLESLVKEEVLRFDQATGAWQWDILRVRAQNISDNVIDLMLRKIETLPPPTREALQVAACIGNTFDPSLVGAVTNSAEEEVRARLMPAIEDGLLATVNGKIHFTHDRIQQAAYQVLPALGAQQIHFRLGHYMRERIEGKEGLLEAVEQLNLGSNLIESQDERVDLARLNLEAGLAAKASMAYDSARGFFSMGLGHLDPGPGHLDFSRESRLLFELRLQHAEIEFNLGKGVLAAEELRNLLKQAPDLAARARIYEQLIDISTQLDISGGIATGMEALKELGVDIPEVRSPEVLVASLQELQGLLQPTEALLSLPEVTDENELAVMSVLTHLAAPAYIAGSDLFPFITISMLHRTLERGISGYSVLGLSAYGMLLLAVLGLHEEALAISHMATRLAERPNALVVSSRVNFYHAAFLVHWCRPYEQSFPFFEKGLRMGIESGDLQFASYSINHLLGNELAAGRSLLDIEEKINRFSETVAVLSQEEAQRWFALLKRFIQALRYPGDDLPELSEDIAGERAVDYWRRNQNLSMLNIYYLLSSFLALIMDKPEQALEAAIHAGEAVGGHAGTIWVPLQHYIHALALCSACRSGAVERSSALQQIGEQKDLLAAWAKNSPGNYLAKQLILEAELSDLQGEDLGIVLESYDRAIAEARNSGRTIEEGLALERAAACWSRRDKPHLTGLYLFEALQTYGEWKADGKVSHLLLEHSSRLARLPLPEGLVSPTSTSSSSELHVADVQSMLKIAQTVAGELVLDRMLARLIELLVESAGAENGSLLLNEAGEWFVVAEQKADTRQVEVMQWLPLAKFPDLPASIIHYVSQTLETVNLEDASKSTLFGTDEAITRRHCKSILCLPVLNRGSLSGILYLENSLSTHAFTRAHTRILQLLTMQAISSLEISRYYAQVHSLNEVLKGEIEERKRTESKLEFLANHDALTNLPNRRLFFDRVQHSIARAGRTREGIAVLFLDLDRFKTINDTLSHQVGDLLLKAVSERLRTLVREGDTLGRLGGDEYVLLLESSPELHDLNTIANKLLSAFHEPFRIEGHDLYPTASIGISRYPDDASDANELLRHADAAMYQAKEEGRNTYQFFSEELAAAAADQLALEHELRRAVSHQEFVLFMQPLVSLKSGRIVGGETLIRWNRPGRGLLLPNNFIPVAEQCGTILPIGEWVLHQACTHLAEWGRLGLSIGRLSVNVSGSQFSVSSGFVEAVRSVLHSTGIKPGLLEIELTESVIMNDSEYAMRSLADLHDLGVGLAIDDFGTGYSSLAYLKRLPVDRLKIDRSFVCNLPEALDDAMIVQSILMLGKNLGKLVVAEGVETEDQRQFLQTAGCAEGQGYLFGEPMPLSVFTNLLRQQNGLDESHQE